MINHCLLKLKRVIELLIVFNFQFGKMLFFFVVPRFEKPIVDVTKTHRYGIGVENVNKVYLTQPFEKECLKNKINYQSRKERGNENKTGFRPVSRLSLEMVYCFQYYVHRHMANIKT